MKLSPTRNLWMTTSSSDSRPTFIYLLRDPRTNDVRYVGKTLDPSLRLSRHIQAARRGVRTHVACWILSLERAGLKPVLEIIETCGDEWAERERYWIGHYGDSLTNHSLGGDGAPGVTLSPETIAKRVQSRKGYKHSVATREKLSKAAKRRKPRKGWHHTEQTREKLSEARIGQRRGPDTKGRIVNPWVVARDPSSYKFSEPHRTKIGDKNRGASNGMSVLDEQKVSAIKHLLLEGQLTHEEIAAQFGVSRSLIGQIQRNQRWRHVPWPKLNLGTTQ